jgi:hypothetical protein
MNMDYGSFCQRIKKCLLFITSRSYNVAFLKRYRFLHLVFGIFLPFTSALVIAKLSMSVLVLYQILSKLGDNCPFFSIHLNFQNGSIGHLGIWPTLSLL